MRPVKSLGWLEQCTGHGLNMSGDVPSSAILSSDIFSTDRIGAFSIFYNPTTDLRKGAPGSSLRAEQIFKSLLREAEQLVPKCRLGSGHRTFCSFSIFLTPCCARRGAALPVGSPPMFYPMRKAPLLYFSFSCLHFLNRPYNARLT